MSMAGEVVATERIGIGPATSAGTSTKHPTPKKTGGKNNAAKVTSPKAKDHPPPTEDKMDVDAQAGSKRSREGAGDPTRAVAEEEAWWTNLAAFANRSIC